MTNQDIKNLAKSKGVYLWQIADELGIGEYTLIRRFRKPLSKEDKEKIINAIKKLSKKGA